MDIGTFDEAREGMATVILTECARVERWVKELVAARPFGSADALLQHADALAAGWGAAEVEEALSDHPRVGERHPGLGRSAALSRRELSGVDAATTTAQRLADANRRYEERFGRIFLIRAAGRSGDEILEQLEQRLLNDPDTEVAVAAAELREIAMLRLRSAFA